MNLFDLAVVAVLASSVWGGYRLGLVAGGTSWVFLLQGLLAASLASPLLVNWLPVVGLRLVVGVAVLVLAGFGAQWLGRRAGTEFRRALIPAEFVPTDRALGAVVGPIAVLVAVWLIVLPPMRQVPGWTADLAGGSALATGIDAALGAGPTDSQALRWLTRPVAQPEVLTALGPAGDSSPPPRTVSLSADVVRRVSASTVKIEGEACFLDREGSGFVVDDDLVVTNAHVVAGGEKTAVVRPDGKRLPATVVVFDARRDLALLSVRNLGQAPLPLGDAREGTLGAVFGHPGGQDKLEVSPASIRQELTATIRDAAFDGPTRRNVFVLAADLAPGDSGGALVNEDGQVAGVAFAVSSAREGVAFALTIEELRPVLAADRAAAVDTGDCF